LAQRLQQCSPYFRELDQEALKAQNQFRLGQVALIFGGAVATILGAVQAALAKQMWARLVETIWADALTGIIYYTQQMKAQERYFTNRLKAEALRGEYFLFLGRIGPYADDENRISYLITRVADINAGEER
jgi:hypothetical protein